MNILKSNHKTQNRIACLLGIGKIQLWLFLISLGITTTIFAQTTQSNFINYQGVASNAEGDVLANETITVGIALKYGLDVDASYAEDHTVLTDANGVFSLKIGDGMATLDTYENYQWYPEIASFLTVSINGSEIGTTELLAVPFALSSGDSQWFVNGNDEIQNKSNKTVKTRRDLIVDGSIALEFGQAVDEISIDGTLSDNSDQAIPTERAVKAYVDNNTSNINQIDDLSDGKSDLTSLYLGNNAGLSNVGDENRNVGIGVKALQRNTSGKDNTAIGFEALISNTTGDRNTALGFQSLANNETGNTNTGIGFQALISNTSASNNTATGSSALAFNTTGSANTGYGASALLLNTSGFQNTAVGTLALQNNIQGAQNTAVGLSALINNETGNRNTAVGRQSLQNATGSFNVAVGNDALNDVTTGSNNIGIGADAQVPSATASHQVRVGNNQITYAGVQVAWTITSDAAWKDDIQPLPYGLNMVTQLKPVDYLRINNEDETREIGFIAQDVEVLFNKLGYKNTGMLTRDDDGRLSLRYNDFIPIITKAVQELNDKTVALEHMNDQLLKRIIALEEK